MKKLWKLGSVPSRKLKFNLKMKLSLLFLITTVFAIRANSGYSQNTKISLEMNNATVAEVIDEIETNTEFKFIFNTNALDLERLVSISVEKKGIKRVLNLLFEKEGVSFEIYDRKVLLKKTGERATIDEVVPAANEFQQINVTGSVVDSNGTPLPGASILEKGTTNGVQADFDGNFSITVAGENSVLVVSYIGFATKEILVGNQTTFEITLEESAAGLDEVVVVGYGTQKKSDLTGSIASINEEDFQNNAQTSVDQMLQGRVAGLRVSQTSAQPGGGVSVRIRGNSSLNASNEPLYVIDGIPILNSPPIQSSGSNIPINPSTNPLNTINPEDIESVEVLKDASASAIYGSRGANGVILITTKSGSEGAVKIQYNTSTGLQNVANPVELLNGQAYVSEIGAIAEAEGSPLTPSLSNSNINTDWQEVLFETALMQIHNVSVSGGTATTNFFGSANYTNQEGVVRSSGFERMSTRLNFDVKKDKFSASANISYSYTIEDLLAFGSTQNNLNLDAGVIRTTLEMPSTIPLFDADGNFSNPADVTLDNPVKIADGVDIKGRTSRALINLWAAYDILDNVQVSARVGGDILNSRRDAYRSTSTVAGAAVGGVANVLTSESNNYTVEALLNYNNTFDKHTLEAVGGYTYQNFDIRNFNGSTRGFPDDNFRTDNLGAGTQEFHTLGSSRDKEAFASFLGRVNYTFNNKVLFTSSIRADGSSRFSEGNKWGVFPSFSLGYRLSEEKFLKNIDFINTMKVRAGWGQIGNAQTPNAATLTTFESSSPAILNDAQVVGLIPARIPNTELSWETTEQLNFGLDFAFFNYRINGSLDVYDKKTKDLLFAQPVPLQTGFSFQFVNLTDSEISNSGVELSLTTVNTTGKFGWETMFNFTYNHNEIKSLGEIEQIIDGDIINKVGEAPFSYFGLQSIGTWQEGEDIANSAQPNAVPGHPKWKDINNDGVINGNDRTILGDPYADYTWGLKNTFSYGGLSLSIFLEGVEGIELLNGLLANTYLPFDPFRNRLAEPIVNRWTPSNPTNTWPSFVNTTSYGSTNTNSYTVQDASFVRINNVRLQYDFDMKRSQLINNLSLSLSGQNLALFTDYLGFDPDVASSGNTRTDIDSYPNSRTFLLGFQVGF